MVRAKLKKKQGGTTPKLQSPAAGPKVICLAEAFGPTLVGLGFRDYEANAGSRYPYAQLERTDVFREHLLGEIGCGRALKGDAARLFTNEGVRALDDCAELYQCLKLTIDRSPQLAPIHNFHKELEKFRERVEVTRNNLHELLRQNDALLYADEFQVDSGPPETSGDDMIILYGPLLRSMQHDLRDLSEYLEGHAVRLRSIPMGPGRGRPRKYSLGFAIMRLAQIYHRFGAGRPKPGVSLTMLPTVKYGGPFFRFASAFLRSVDGPTKQNTDQALGGTVQEILKVWNRDQEVHLFIRTDARTSEIIKFVKRYDEIRAELGLVQQK
jgi:hypothetical protein